MSDEPKERHPLDYARNFRPKPRDWGTWGVVTFGVVLLVAFFLLIVLVALIDN